ncbi:MAG: 2-oxoacid:acceptor oxidoreductase subunit alpha [Candidatus Nomurabacteria bacterium]|nr:MAG: 2-oxoacid:acceptor oxidoreductase subunit alpha [Candidatus Nomurabacteria bacterium]
MEEITLKIGGIAGAGIKSTGEIFAKICLRSGWHVFDYTEYPSLIRGGHNTYHVRAATEPIWSTVQYIHILIALNEEAVRLHLEHVIEGGVVVYDPSVVDAEKLGRGRSDVRFCAVPFAELAISSGGIEKMGNMVSIGAVVGLLHGSLKITKSVIADIFATKGEQIVSQNEVAAEAGYEYVQEHFSEPFAWTLHELDAPEQMLVAGNEALGFGALAGGVQFYAGYPMTPSSSILHFMAKYGPKQGVVVKHASDEIGAVNMCIGAGFAGARAMTASSGGGFSLMVESLGLAGITETPIVITEVQRGGPATGLPTWTEQADLRFVAHASQGEFPRVLLAPASVEECFTHAALALNLAEIAQTPVLILSDKLLAESQKSTEPFTSKHVAIDRGKLMTTREANRQKDYHRYEITEDGISPRAVPGLPNTLFLANSDEHDTYGYSEENAENRTAMVDKRARKLEQIKDLLPKPIIIGPKQADYTFITWGSTMGPVLDAMRILEAEGHSVQMYRLPVILPFPSEEVTQFLETTTQTILVENNSEGQLGGLIREKTGYELDVHMLKYDGRPFFPEEIVQNFLAMIEEAH